MKVSEITTMTVANYLRLDDATDPLLTPILAVAKKFIEGYTNIYDQNITDTYTANGITNGFKASMYPFIASTLVVKVNGVTKTLTTDYTVDAVKGIVTLVAIPSENDEITIDYTFGVDAFEEFWLVVMILCQDMYDNRTLVVDNTNMNRTVETILNLHRRNLLPSVEEV